MKNDKTKVKDIKGNEVEENAKAVAPQEPQMLQISVDEANMYTNILGVLFLGDDRLKVAQTHFIEMIKRNNEINQQQPTK